jgi:hypothetical protein
LGRSSRLPTVCWRGLETRKISLGVDAAASDNAVYDAHGAGAGALRTGHASLAGPGAWHDYPRMPDPAAMERTLQQLWALERAHERFVPPA